MFAPSLLTITAGRRVPDSDPRTGSRSTLRTSPRRIKPDRHRRLRPRAGHRRSRPTRSKRPHAPPGGPGGEWSVRRDLGTQRLHPVVGLGPRRLGLAPHAGRGLTGGGVATEDEAALLLRLDAAPRIGPQLAADVAPHGDAEPVSTQAL